MKKKPRPKPNQHIAISEWLESSSDIFKSAGVSSYKLDSELILGKVLGVNRTFLHVFPGKRISKKQLFHANNWRNKRAKRVPLAQIFKEKEFYGRSFTVSADTLIPRPETEAMIDLYKKVVQDKDVVLDVGTGSGIIAITCYKESLDKGLIANISACDISDRALSVASENIKTHKSSINLYKSDLLADMPLSLQDEITIIMANLPYVNSDWIDKTKSNELHHEPEEALYAEDAGMDLIKKLIQQSAKLKSIKFLILEADPEQHPDLIDFAKKYSFSHVETNNFAFTLKMS